MNRRLRAGFALLALAVLAAPAVAQFDRTSLFINVPTADVLPRGTLMGVFVYTEPLTSTPASFADSENGAAIRYAPFSRLELSLTAYTRFDYVLGATYQIIDGRRRRVPVLWLRGTEQIEGFEWIDADKPGFSLAVGVHDVGRHAYVSPIGNGLRKAWPDWKYKNEKGESNRPMENFSAFVVASIPVTDFARAHAGLGRGRYVGRDRGGYLNTDLFFPGENQWAIGLFGGLELTPVRFLSMGLDFDGRDVNLGLRLRDLGFSIDFAVTKVEGLTTKRAKGRFARFALGLGYGIGGRRGR